MQVAMEEMSDLKGVWVELSKIWEQIDELKEKPWLSVQPRKVVRPHMKTYRRYAHVVNMFCSFVSRSTLSRNN